MLLRLPFYGTVLPRPYMRCSALFRPRLFCLPYATATSKTYSARMNSCKRHISIGLWILWHILCSDVAWGASKLSLKTRFPLCSLHTSSTPGPQVAHTTHTICTRASSHVSEHPLKIDPWVSFHGTSDTLVLRRSSSCSPCNYPVSKISWCRACLPASTHCL